MRISDWSSDVCSSDLIKDRLGDLLLRWPNGCLEENILPFFEPEDLEALLSDPEDRRSGQRRKSLAERLGILDRDRQSVVSGQSVSVRVDLGGRGIIKKKQDEETARYQANNRHT